MKIRPIIIDFLQDFLLRKRIRGPAQAKNLLILSPNTRKFSSTKYQLPFFNQIKTSFLGFQVLPLLLLHVMLTLYSLYSQVMLILILIKVPYLENVFNFERGSNSQNDSLSKSLHNSHNPIKISFIAKFAIALTWNGENKTIRTTVSENKTILKKFGATVHECY